MQALDPVEIPDLLASLVERSLVVFDPSANRYHLTESMRAYAQGQLGAEEDLIRRKHFDYFQSLAEEIHRLSVERDLSGAIRMATRESDNFRAALEWIARGDPKDRLHFVVCLANAWFRAYPGESRQALVQALEDAPEADDADHMWAALSLAYIKVRMGEPEDAEILLKNSLAFAVAHEMPLAALSALLILSWHGAWVGDWEAAQRYSVEVIEMAQSLGLRDALATGYVHLGEVARHQGDWQEAQRAYLKAIEYCGLDAHVPVIAYFNLGCVSVQREDAEAGQRYFMEAVQIARRSAGVVLDSADGIMGLGFVAVLRGDFQLGGLLMGFSQNKRDRRAIALDPIDKKLFDHFKRIGEDQGGEAFLAAYEQGSHLTLREVYEKIGI